MSKQDSNRRLEEANYAKTIGDLIEPFVSKFEDWNNRAAQIGATLASPLVAGSSRPAQRRLLRALIEEVETAQASFASTVSEARDNGRISDVRAAFDRSSKS
jgi:hypothetical protein